MANQSPLQVQEKKEFSAAEESTTPGRSYVPYTDIYESNDALTVSMEMPGVEKKDIDIQLEHNVLTVQGQVDIERYQRYRPAYTEYNIGHFSRSFRLNHRIDQSAIEARVEDGVLQLTLPKVAEPGPQRVQIQ